MKRQLKFSTNSLRLFKEDALNIVYCINEVALATKDCAVFSEKQHISKKDVFLIKHHHRLQTLYYLFIKANEKYAISFVGRVLNK